MPDQIQKRDDSKLVGTYAEPNAVNQRMSWAQENAHLISPATAVGAMPEGCGIALSIVTVDVENDTYNLSGKRGLSKTVLQKLGAALGVSWDPVLSGRVDDGSDSHYCRWRAVGTYRAFDGQVQTIVAEKELDLRDGSPTVVGLQQQQAAKNKSADSQVREMRMHIQQHAETKAQLRAVRSLGIKTAYTTDELQRPFVAARIMFTGQSKDPVLRAEFARMTAASFLSGQASLYGRQLPPAQGPATLGALPPPPVGTNRIDEEDAPAFIPTSRERKSDPPPAGEAKPEKRSTRKAESQGQAAGAERSGHKMPFGRSKDVAIEDAPLQDIEWMANTIGEKLDSGESRYPDKDEVFHKALIDEIARREGTGKGEQQELGGKL